MEEFDHRSEESTSSNLPNIQDSTGNSRFSQAIEHIPTLNIFHFIAGFCQVILGLAVITISMLGLINPFWVSLMLTMAASATTMIGLYFVYITFSKSYDSHSLVRNAMQRVMKAKN